MGVGNRQLLAFTFPAGSRFEGQLVGAAERIESGGAMRILAALFVAREPDSDQFAAVSMTTDGRAGMIAKLLDFRLDERARKKVTQLALDSPAGDTVRGLADALGPGEAVAGVLVEHTWALTLADAVGRTGGSQLLSEFVDDQPGQEWNLLLAAVAEQAAPPG